MLDSRTRRSLLWLIPVVALLTACQGNRNNSQARLARQSPEGLYDQARRSLRASDYAQAIRVYEALTARYPFTPQSRQSRLDLIYAYFRVGEKESATDAADTFIRENPAHPRIDYAWYLKGLIEYERLPNAMERWFNADLSERAPLTARASFQSLKTVVERFPKSAYAHDARRRMIYLRNRLAAHELEISRYYMERGAWVAAAQRARQAIEQYDGAPAIKDALRALYLCYTELNYTELAVNTELVFRDNFPEDRLEFTTQEKRWWRIWGHG